MKRLLLVMAALCFVLPNDPLAQTINATLGGTVADASGALIPGVSITATNTATGIVTTVVTNEAGAYNFASIQSGSYKVTARIARLSDADLQQRSSGRLPAGPAEFFLQVGGVAQSVEVNGMGDNVYLGDRDGVRTPMQWSPDRNGGFSRANPQALYAPPIQDPIYGFQGVNVEAQQQSPDSLLNWMKRLIGVRQGRQTFGRGTLTFLYPRNRKVLAYLREHEGETILCIYNLSRNAQAADLELTAFRDRVPVELLGRTAFPPIADPSYRMTLPGYGFYWLVLTTEAELPSWHQATPEPLPELITIVVHDSWRAISESQGGQDLARFVLPEYLPKQLWFDSRRVDRVRLVRAGAVRDGQRAFLLAELAVEPADGAACFLLPFAASWGEEHLAAGSPLLPYTLARVRRGALLGALHDATLADEFARVLIHLMDAAREVETGDLVPLLQVSR